MGTTKVDFEKLVGIKTKDSGERQIKDGTGFITKDSGKREVFESGMVRDIRVGKGRFDLIPPQMLRRLAGLYERGAVKYGDSNWQKGALCSRFMDSALRHINEYREGYRDEDHIIAAIWNLTAIVYFEETNPSLNDIYIKDEFKVEK